jgi:hypothetical protein
MRRQSYPGWLTEERLDIKMHNLLVFSGIQLKGEKAFWMRYKMMREYLKERTEELCKDV